MEGPRIFYCLLISCEMAIDGKGRYCIVLFIRTEYTNALLPFICIQQKIRNLEIISKARNVSNCINIKLTIFVLETVDIWLKKSGFIMKCIPSCP